MADPAPTASGGPRLHFLRSRTVRAGLALAAVGGTALAYASANDLEGGILARGGPAALRFGLSLAGGWVLGWALRRVRVAALAAVTVLAGAVLLLRQLGMLTEEDLDLRDAADRTLAGASHLKDLAYGYLPSGAAAAVGGFLGFWSKGSEEPRGARER